MSKKIFEEDCFIICPLGEEKSPERIHSDKLLNHVFKPILDANQYNTVRADQVSKAGLITTQIINCIIESELVIADLTDQNPNVFYELALRHATNKPYIQVITKGQRIPFDLRGIRTIAIDVQDLDDVARAKLEIENQILEMKSGHIADSPVTIATTTKLLQDEYYLAETIAERIGHFRGWSGGYDYENSKEIESISRKLWSFREYGSISLEDLESKIDAIADKLDDIQSQLDV